ncbi:MAG: hypothetical protein M5U30_15540 [Burkholderiaceae bacterium]|nr:hypothetical protein [Burkholderiaceae bacterium]
MALVLNDLHGNLGRALSNQMRQTRSLAPEYSVRWWAERGMRPPDLDPVALIEQKISWRYAKGPPSFTRQRMILGNSVDVLPRLRRSAARFDLLFTSPPYIGVADYHYDQWLRLWLLGGSPVPHHANDDTMRGDFAHREKFRSMIARVFTEAARLLKPDGVVYVRTDARPTTLAATREALESVFPEMTMHAVRRPFEGRTQTHLFGDREAKPGEIDLVLTQTQSRGVGRIRADQRFVGNRQARLAA